MDPLALIYIYEGKLKPGAHRNWLDDFGCQRTKGDSFWVSFLDLIEEVNAMVEQHPVSLAETGYLAECLRYHFHAKEEVLSKSPLSFMTVLFSDHQSRGC